MESTIRVQGLSKQYRLGASQGAGYRTLRESLSHAAQRTWGRVRRVSRSADASEAATPDRFWALDDVSFDVQPGEVVGIIGRNGAGKSTLLKILSRITEPTHGRATIRGRVGSLLEVGTGFHPELTGRENIYMNGSILGMGRREIARRFDEIVAFAETEQFLDTPVKRYSSGMYVRLAFAVAAHLEPEILIIDEVLAVGDASFQKKCLGRLDEVARGGRAVLFVSHNMAAVIQVCNRALMLKRGRVDSDGAPATIVRRYLSLQKSAQDDEVNLAVQRRPCTVRGTAILDSCRLETPSEGDPWTMPYGGVLAFRVGVTVRAALEDLELGIGLFTASGFEVASVLSTDVLQSRPIAPGCYVFSVSYPRLCLMPGSYYLGIGLRSRGAFEDYIPDAVHFEIQLNERSARNNIHLRKGSVVPEFKCTMSRCYTSNVGNSE
ncbi:MAG TPA: ABC transporter ATP-binding protein [Pirellulales bacterium]|nr:ABC transporter ATP-binding protein [Pirellulales bacterium]